MTALANDVDYLVGEVLRRLRAQAVVDQAQPPEAATATETEQLPAPGVLRLSEQVISLETIQQRLEGVRQIVLAPKAVLTPSVRDLLRRRRIALTRAPASANGRSACGQGRLIVAASQAQVDPQQIQALVADQLPGTTLAGQDLLQLIPQFSDLLANRWQLGLLLCQQPAAALCLANRCPTLRAVQGYDPSCVADAVQSVGANLLVINPQGRSLFQMARLVQRFVTPLPRECPLQYRPLLQGPGDCRS